MHACKQRLVGSGRSPRERGYILLVLSLFAALIAVGLMRTLPPAFVQTQREREEELIFRGEQYRRAVQAYVRKFGRYPNSLDDLEDTNGVRFLRRRYRDPVTEQDEWRLIHVGPGGTFPDAKTAGAAPGQNPAAQPGGTGLTPSPGMPGSPTTSEPRGFAPQPSQFEATSSGFGGSPAPGPGNSPASGLGGAPASGLGLTPPPSSSEETGPVLGENPDPALRPPMVPDPLRPSADPTANPAQQPRAFGAAQQPGGQQPGTVAFGGGGIAGVASQSTDPSIKVYNGYLQYDEWEFIYNFQGDQFGLAAVARATGGAVPGGPPGAPVQPGAPPPGVMTNRPASGFPGIGFPAGLGQGQPPPGTPGVAPRFPAAQFPGMPPGAQPGQGPSPGGFAQPGFGPTPGGFPGAQPRQPGFGASPGGFGAQPGLSPTPVPGASPGTQPNQSPFAPRPFPGTQPGQSPFAPRPAPGSGQPQSPTSPVPGFPSNPQPRP